MKGPHWMQQMRDIAQDFEDADVKAFRFTKIRGRVTCVVTVLDADSRLVMWELVDDDVSADRWRKMATKKFNEETHPADNPILGNLPSAVRDAFIDTLNKPSTKKSSLGASTSGIICEPGQIGSCPDREILPAILEAINPWSRSKRTED